MTALLSPNTAAAVRTADNQAHPGSDYQYVEVLQVTQTGMILEFSPPPPLIDDQQVEGMACQTMAIDGLVTLEEVGQPALPVQGIMLGIPPDSQPEIEVLVVETTLVGEDIRLCPTLQPIFSRNMDQLLTLTGYQYPEISTYTLDGFSAPRIADLVSTGYIRYQRFAQLRLNPLQYNPSTGAMQYHHRIQVKIQFNAPASPARSASEAVVDPFFEDVLKGSLLNYDQAKVWRISPQPVPAMTLAIRQDQPAYKIEVAHDGLYQLGYDDLLKAGVPLAELDPRTIRLFNHGIEVAVYIKGEADGTFDQGDVLLFYGQQARTKYTDTNAYWLTWGAELGLRMGAADGDPSGSTATVPGDFLTTLHLQENSSYLSAAPSGIDDDRWYWGFVNASSGPFEINFDLAHLAVGVQTASLRGLIKPYYSSPTPHIRIFLNQEVQPLFDGNLTTSPEYNFTVNFDQSQLNEGTNTLRVEIVNTSETILINWFELDYHVRYVAKEDQLYFRGDTPGTFNFQVDGFTSPSIEVVDLTDPQAPERIINPVISTGSQGYKISFISEVTSSHQFTAQETNQRLAPLSIAAVERSNWKSPAIGADYIIITHADFYEGAQTLSAFRESPHFRVQVIDVQDLYDEFNGGVFSPQAIRDFLAYAFHNWQAPAPSYVLLLGDGHYDFKDYTNSGVPVFMPPYLANVDPFMGETAADNRYVAVSGDDILPDMYLGRLPARSVEEANIMVGNIIQYEGNPPEGDWNTRLTFVADNPDSGGNFPAESDKIISYVPAEYTNEKIYFSVNYTDASTARAAVISAVNEGRLILHYVGHGSLFRWASEGLLRLEDLGNFYNDGNLFFSVPMTCLEGYFIRPTAQSLGESIVRIAGGGAIASYSPTGYGMAAGHALLDVSLINNLFNFNQNQLGFLTTNAKYDLYAQSGGYRDLIDTFILFGDPALRLHTLRVDLPAPSDLTAAPVSTTQIKLAWTDNAADESAYYIERSLTGAGGWTQIAEVGANIMDYSDTGLNDDTTYYYRARAYRAGDGLYSPYSNIAHATTGNVPALPTNLSAQAISSTRIDLSWTDNAADETAYHIERSLDGSTDWQEIIVLPADRISYSDTGLTPGTTYFYRVRAYRASDGLYSGYTKVASATTIDRFQFFLPLISH